MLVAVAEGAVVCVAMVRVALGQVDLQRVPHLAWLVACVALAGLAPVSFVLRSLAVAKRERAGEPVEGERRQVLVMSLALLFPPAAVAIAGPRLAEALLGG
jgi:hypothetical protein